MSGSTPASGRRTAKRRPAGPARPGHIANDLAPSIGGLIFALQQKPSRRPLEIAAVGSAVWALISIVLGWAMLVPELQRAPTFMEMLTRPTAITLAATVILPIALFWFMAMLSWRAQELRLASSAMTEVAIRLVEPDRMAEQQIASVGQAVRRQVSFMDEAVSRALGRAGEIEALVHNEVASLERSYGHNEQRIRGLLQELSGERNALLNTSERVNVALRELSGEIPSLIDKLGDQQVKLAKFIEDAGQNLVALETSISANATHLAQTVGARTHELDSVLTDRAGQIAGLLSDGTQRIETALTTQSQDVQALLMGRAEEMQGHFNTFSSELDKTLGTRTEGLQAVLEEYTRALDSALVNRQEALGGLLAKREQTLDGMLSNRQLSFESQLIDRTRALDEAFTERLKLFDDSIVRSTIAVDSMVADKARALSSAMEMHAKEIGSVLGRQAGELDEQLMHGVNAVRRASENVTRQSVKAIEGLANQADLLKNVSENLVNQISSVTDRFDSQGRTIMSAANALETANFRIDKTLQNRQQELSSTLDQLSTRTSQIDDVMRGYSTTLEGTFTQAEERARHVGDQLSRSAEERARAMRGELERLQAQSSGESERSIADMRAKYSTVAREVSEEIGSLSSRFSDTSDEMRRRAQSTLSEIELEQTRLRDKISSLPEVTRASADSMRAALQDQLKALEQLSSLSNRESQRGDISPPMTLMPVEPASQQSGRSISSLTQTLASEMAHRGRASFASSPQSGGQPPVQYKTNIPPPAAALAPTGQVTQAGMGDQNRDGWSLGDLLARASKDEEVAQSAGSAIDIHAIARALDATTAAAIWSRFRAGQRGLMVRSIYSPDGRQAFDEVQRRYKTDPAVQQSVDRYMGDFENVLRDADHRDPGGRMAQSYIVMDQGRVYLFLAHASGRLV